MLEISPNPCIIVRKDHIKHTGTITAKNSGNNPILFKIDIDGDVFCGISPTIGEIKPGESRTINYIFEDPSMKMPKTSFQIKYCSTPEALLDDTCQWDNFLDVVIRFATHAEEALINAKTAINAGKSLSEAYAKSNVQNHDVEMAQLYDRRISSKESQNKKLRETISALEKKRDEELLRKKRFQDEQPFTTIIAILSFIALILIVIIRVFQ